MCTLCGSVHSIRWLCDVVADMLSSVYGAAGWHCWRFDSSNYGEGHPLSNRGCYRVASWREVPSLRQSCRRWSLKKSFETNTLELCSCVICAALYTPKRELMDRCVSKYVNPTWLLSRLRHVFGMFVDLESVGSLNMTSQAGVPYWHLSWKLPRLQS